MEPILRVENITKRFGGLTAVNRVNLEVNPGEVVGLVGDNGAGKSTLIKMVSGVYHPSEGAIYFEGKPAVINTPSQARDMGIETIYQDLALAGNLTMSANIFLGRERKKKYLGGAVRILDEKFMLQEALKLLETLDVHLPAPSAKIEKLSGGQRQAVAIARALYWNARLMIMDEPTNNLGVIEQAKVLDLIRRLKEQHVPVILISHTMRDIFAVSDRIIVLHRGRKVADKRTSETSNEELVQYIMGARDDFEAARA
ncbi:MAG: sugar ABC transporter ATP-binding protein [Chloroflexi bacterium]|nr:sugar ABC transporter ATP-binding protein [Chloroflexota bacterium]